MDMQVQILEELIALTEAASIPIWLYGGYALDALEGKSTQPHGDIDFFVRRRDKERLINILSSAGFRVVESAPHCTIFNRMGQSVECLTYERLDDNTPVTDTGETGVYPWPDNSFPDECNAELVGKPARVVSYEAQYVFKAGYQTFNPAQPLRKKDAEDLKIICQRILPEVRERLASLFEPLPGTRKCYPNDMKA